jgi:hypothetical protein
MMNTVLIRPILKRNAVEYDCVDGATAEDVRELREFVQEFQNEVLLWLKNKR